MSKPERMDGYIRVSRVKGRDGEGFISPTVQREQIEGWARLRGVEIADWHEDLDQSGGKLKRPGLDALLARIDAHDTEGVVVAKLDRLSRLGVGDALKLVERITNAGASIAAVDLGLDPTTPFGEFGMTIMLAMGRMERRRLADSWAIAQERAVARGAKVSRTPYGYKRMPDGTMEVHPVQSMHVKRAFEIAAARGVSAASAYLVEHVPEKYWTTATTRRLLSRRSYLGESRHGQHFNATAHEPLVSSVIFEAAQHDPRAWSRLGDYPLSGTARCATCGAAMVAGPKSGGRKRLYRCSAVQTLHRGPRCPQPASIVAENLESHVREYLSPILAGIDVDSLHGSDELTLAERAVMEAEGELEAFAADLTMRRALGERYHEHLASRVEAVESARVGYRRLAKYSQAIGLLTTENVLEDPQMFGALLGSMGLSIVVKPGPGEVAGRVSIAPTDH
jgi:site-specific DNA recombinase